MREGERGERGEGEVLLRGTPRGGHLGHPAEMASCREGILQRGQCTRVGNVQSRCLKGWTSYLVIRRPQSPP